MKTRHVLSIAFDAECISALKTLIYGQKKNHVLLFLWHWAEKLLFKLIQKVFQSQGL